jgi:hypothetical protein
MAMALAHENAMKCIAQRRTNVSLKKYKSRFSSNSMQNFSRKGLANGSGARNNKNA